MMALFDKGYCPIEPIWKAMGYSPEDMKQMIADNFGGYFDPNYNKAAYAVLQSQMKGMDITKPPRGGEMTPEGEVSLPEGVEGLKEGLEVPKPTGKVGIGEENRERLQKKTVLQTYIEALGCDEGGREY